MFVRLNFPVLMRYNPFCVYLIHYRLQKKFRPIKIINFSRLITRRRVFIFAGVVGVFFFNSNFNENYFLSFPRGVVRLGFWTVAQYKYLSRTNYFKCLITVFLLSFP